MCLFDLSTLEEDEAALSVKNSESSVVGMTCYYIHMLLCPMVQVVIQQGNNLGPAAIGLMNP